MEVKHKNFKEDMKLLISLGKKYNGEPFRLTITSGKLGICKFICSFDGKEYENCVMADDTHVLCLLDNHSLPCGLVYLEMQILLKDGQMPDGDFKVVYRGLLEFLIDGRPYHLELTNGQSDEIETLEMTVELLGKVIKGDKGDQGEPLRYQDLTERQIQELQRPAIEAADIAQTAARLADVATRDSKKASELATEKASTANEAASAANLAKDAADNATRRAEEAIDAANLSAAAAVTAAAESREQTSLAISATDEAHAAATEANNAKEDLAKELLLFRSGIDDKVAELENEVTGAVQAATNTVEDLLRAKERGDFNGKDGEDLVYEKLTDEQRETLLDPFKHISFDINDNGELEVNI